MTHQTLKILLGVLVIVAIVGGAVYWQWPWIAPVARPPQAEAAPTITWTPAAVNREVGRGETKSVPVTFTASENATNVSVRVVPGLQPVVSTNPTTFPSIEPDKTYTLVIMFVATSTTQVGTIDGTIQFRTGPTLAQPLPVTVLVTVVPLPPEPGEAGRATLEGIDSDGDGVRDDVQRYIALTYPNSAKTRAALTQYARAGQATLLDANNRDASLRHTVERQAGIECLNAIRAEDAKTVRVALRAQLLNTSDRSRAWIAADAQVSGNVFFLPSEEQMQSGCTFDPTAMPN